MANPNYFDLSGPSTRIQWYPKGKGGPIVAGGSPANAPTVIITSGSIDATISGNDLTVGPSTPVGTFVVAVIKKNNTVPGAQTSIAVLIPDVIVDTSALPVNTIGILSVYRGTAQLGAGQLETYTEFPLQGTAANIALAQ
jgi:hypothetical protein